MSHMVIYRGSDGKPGYHQTDDIHDAVGFVEQMRNDQGVEHARIFRLEEVVFQYKPYYRVELADSGFVDLGTAESTAENGLANGASNGHGNGNGVTSDSADGSMDSSAGNELSISGNGGVIDAAGSSGSGSADGPAPATTNSGASSASADDGGGSKRGLFGR